MSPTSTSHTRRSTVHEPAAFIVQTIVIKAENELLLLTRILQKFAVPDVELLAVRFDASQAAMPVLVEVCFRTTPARGRLTAGKLRQLITVQSVEIRHG